MPTALDRKTIMVVDDDRHTLLFVTECLKQMGQEVYSAANGEEALELIRNPDVKIDLLLSDVVMHGMNGIELAQRLTATAPATKIIFMSGYMKPAIPAQNSARDERGFLQKPFSGRTLMNQVKQALAEIP
ncbi:MAG: response regulator [Desulfurivibrionaceae bacterium]|nr:response regulator [Desulfurivibrionaceae bacterium]